MSAAKSIPGPQSSLLWFFIITTLYLPVKYNSYVIKQESTDGETLWSGGVSSVYFIIYVLLVIIGEYFINLGVTSAMCGSTQWSTAISVTVIPWLIIFGLLNVMLLIFPGWLTPFSNTLGYLVTKIMGVGDLFASILQVDNEDGQDEETKKALARIYSDKALMINEIPGDVNGFAKFWNRLKPLMQKKYQYDDENAVIEALRDGGGDPDEGEGAEGAGEGEGAGEEDGGQSKAYQLFGLVRLKNIIAEYVWFMLTGTLVTSVGYNYIINTGCNLSAADMQKRHDEYTEKETILAKEREAQPARTYTSTE